MMGDVFDSFSSFLQSVMVNLKAYMQQDLQLLAS